MTAFTDCRTDYWYNKDFLSEQFQTYISGFDKAIEDIESFFDNLDCTEFDESNLDCTEFDESNLEFIERIKDKLLDKLGSWLEFERNETITAFIDGMDRKEYKRNRKAVLEANAAKPEAEQKKYYDTLAYHQVPFIGPDDECNDELEDDDAE